MGFNLSGATDRRDVSIHPGDSGRHPCPSGGRYKFWKDESLRTFMERFNKMSVKIKNLSDEIVRHHFTTGLKSNPFADKICRKPPKSMDEHANGRHKGLLSTSPSKTGVGE